MQTNAKNTWTFVSSFSGIYCALIWPKKKKRKYLKPYTVWTKKKMYPRRMVITSVSELWTLSVNTLSRRRSLRFSGWNNSTVLCVVGKLSTAVTLKFNWKPNDRRLCTHTNVCMCMCKSQLLLGLKERTIH